MAKTLNIKSGGADGSVIVEVMEPGVNEKGDAMISVTSWTVQASQVEQHKEFFESLGANTAQKKTLSDSIKAAKGQ